MSETANQSPMQIGRLFLFPNVSLRALGQSPPNKPSSRHSSILGARKRSSRVASNEPNKGKGVYCWVRSSTLAAVLSSVPETGYSVAPAKQINARGLLGSTLENALVLLSSCCLDRHVSIPQSRQSRMFSGETPQNSHSFERFPCLDTCTHWLLLLTVER